jgi:predicted flap endonuclease-1-like 5' DNA nuclease
MTPFVQELLSFISLMLGVIVITAWAMWLLLRPSGDTRVKEFSEESARDGLTHCVMENNELKNTVTRLEREIKVLMAAGYGKKKEKGKEDEGEKVKEKDDGSEITGEGLKVGKKVEKKVEATAAVAKPAAVNEKVKQVAKEAPAVAPKEEKQAVTRPVATASSAVSKQPKAPPVSGEVRPVARKDAPSKPLGRTFQEASESVQAAAEAKRVLDEAEKKKIADYLANVEKTQERHKKEVEALELKVENAEIIKYPNNNLKLIKGIGPHLEAKLKKSGITSFQQIAEFSEKDIKRIADEIESFPRRIKREAWVEQARKLQGKG